jgi:hypothetical protein
MINNNVVVIAMTLAIMILTNGCARDADAKDSTAVTPAEQSIERTTYAETDTTWIAIVMIWRPVIYTIDKEFSTEVACWNHYEGGVGESKFGKQHLDHQGNPPTKEFHKKHRPSHREYPTRMYHGINVEQGQVWLTCDIKGRIEGL